MGLERLKSAFSDIIHTSEIEGRHSEKSPTTNTPFLPGSILEATTYAWNSILDEPTDPAGGIEPVDSPLLADLFNNPNTTTTLNDPSSDIRFQVGLGFPSPNTKLVMSMEGVEASIAYFQTGTGDMMLAASGAITKLGGATDALAKIGIDTPALDFGVQVQNPFSEGTLLGDLSKPDPVPLFLTYPMQLEEMFNPTNENLTNEFADTGNPDSTRGIVFQVLGTRNQSGSWPPDFSFQDKVENIKTVEYINPVTGFTPGNIKFKDDYFKDIGQSLGGLADALGPGEGIGDFLGGVGGAFSGVVGGGIKFFTENDFIQGIGKGIGGIFDGMGGFGNELPKPKFPKIDFGKVGDFFSGAGKAVGNFASGVGSAVGNFASGVSDTVGNIADTVKDVGGPIAQAAKELASNLNPIAELTLPKIDLQNPRTVSVTEYGGQAIFRENKPRSLTRNIPLRALSPAENTTPTDRGYAENDVSTPFSQLGKTRYAGVGELGKLRAPTSFYPNASMDETGGGDKMTLAPIKKGTLSVYDEGKVNMVDSADNGMPFFFKDLRDNSYIIFRGYVSGISDTMSPSWNEVSYVGRSESSWIYSGAERSISFTLDIAAQTALELDSIYHKLNKLAGLVYPEYMADEFIQTGTDLDLQPIFKARMKAPLARMRLGDLFGNPNDSQTKDGILGFLKSLSIEWPDESPWEFRYGQRVPKIINISMEWHVIHERVPDKSYPKFFGYNPSREDIKNKKQQLPNTTDLSAQDTAIGG